MKTFRTKVRAGDTVLFKEMEGEVYEMTAHDKKVKTFAVDFYTKGIYIEFKVSKKGYTTTRTSDWLANQTYKPKEFEVIFRPATGKTRFDNKKKLKAILSKLYGCSNKDQRYNSIIHALDLLKKI